ncbi:MAG: hypothetical protein EOO11_14500 [Chitinophagaceae bacterium]|nr:MAG: hypothetical protein EOO11_14500 [Chitinophagaceae bacterium]
MKAFFPLLAALLPALAARGQHWQQRTDYLIEATLHPRARSLDGFERLTRPPKSGAISTGSTSASTGSPRGWKTTRSTSTS